MLRAALIGDFWLALYRFWVPLKTGERDERVKSHRYLDELSPNRASLT